MLSLLLCHPQTCLSIISRNNKKNNLVSSIPSESREGSPLTWLYQLSKAVTLVISKQLGMHL